MPFPVPNETREQLCKHGYFVVTEVTFEVATSLINWILRNRPKQKEFTILINSSGGQPEAVVYLASFLRTLSSEVRVNGVAFGECGSAALAMLQLCHTRYALLNTGFFIHTAELHTRLKCEGEDMSRVQERLDDLWHIQEELVQIQCKRANLPRESWRQFAKYGDDDPGRPITTRTARQQGLIDVTLTKLNLF